MDRARADWRLMSMVKGVAEFEQASQRRDTIRHSKGWRTRLLPDSPSMPTKKVRSKARELCVTDAARLQAALGTHPTRDQQDEGADDMPETSCRRCIDSRVLALTHAERRGLVARNVAKLSEMPAGARAVAEGRSLTEDEARRLFAAAAGDRLEALVYVGLMLGLRPGELGGLLWADVDLDKATVQVRRSLKNEPTGLRLGDPKTRRSFRGLDLPAPVVRSLVAHRAHQAEERAFAGAAWVEHGLVFTTGVGTPIDPANLRRWFTRLSKSAGLGHWTPKELRHSAASLLSASGVPLELVADVLGHDGTRMTGTVYRHAVRPHRRRRRSGHGPHVQGVAASTAKRSSMNRSSSAMGTRRLRPMVSDRTAPQASSSYIFARLMPR